MASAMFAPGAFDFLKCEDGYNFEVMCLDMCRAVEKTGNWENLKRFIPNDGGFMFCKKPEWFSQIDNALEFKEHSGGSYGTTMRYVQYIARHGWGNFILRMSTRNSAMKKKLRMLELPYEIEEAKLNVLASQDRYDNPVDVEYKTELFLRLTEAIDELKSLEHELQLLTG